ncbi:GNAT family N-acetyltransferase [Kiloniella majae]|uniref:GNAT family N-acetyltransferase n=1 Tax=Kiloniella majae TaxID=1938558 RepID=UPI000A27933C|nr:GNAT family N-acetyltransferase [Kiloniella majae]
MMTLSFKTAAATDLETLISIRIAAMKESLENIGRFNPERARERFASNFAPEKTTLILKENEIIGFYVLFAKDDYLWLDHLYIDPTVQSSGVGAKAMMQIVDKSSEKKLPVKLCALKESRANNFYKKHGFKLTHSEEWDNYYTRPYLEESFSLRNHT